MQQSSVIMNLWPYLLALETDERRFNFVEKVYNREFDLEILKIGNEICIRGPPSSEPKYYEFKVKYFGPAVHVGIGSYISLQLKNEHVALTAELESLSRHYQFRGKGIVVPADWVMLHLYKKRECQSESLINMFPELAVVTKTLNSSPSMVIENRFVKPYEKRVRQPSPSVEPQKKFSEMGSTSKSLGQSSNLFGSSTENNVINSTDESLKNSDKPVRMSSPIMEQTKNLNETGSTLKTRLYSPQTEFETSYNKFQNYARNNVEIPLQMASTILEQPQNTKTGAPLLTETNYNKKPQNHAIEIESITKADGAVKNAEKTNCCSCSKIVEIGCGVILRECIHSFCTPCIRSHIENNLKYSGIRCPYSEEYECNFDLLDAEIRDIGGDLIYNRILDNRLKEYVGNDPNARMCFNNNCKHVWVSKWTFPRNNERCPECKMDWCYLCNGKHDPEKHKPKLNATKEKKEEPVVEFHKRLGETKSNEKCVRCSLCSKQAVRHLSLCGHRFCLKCIQDSIKEQGLDDKKKNITCVSCKAPISELDIANIVSKKIFAKVKSKIVVAPKQVDQPLNSGSKVSTEGLKCEKTSKEPLIHKTVSKVADRQMKYDCFEKCGGCNNRANMQLSFCRHWFCNKCIQNSIKNQVFDQNQIYINCTACNDPISDSDVLRYGEKSIFDLYKSKVEAAKLVPEQVDQPLESGSKVSDGRLKCEKTFAEPVIRKKISDVLDRQMNFGVFENCGNCNNRANVQLSLCQHWFCNKCIQSSIRNQAFDPTQIYINCTACYDAISDSDVLRYGEKSIFNLYKSKVEAAKFTQKAVDQPLEDGNKELIECLKCEEKFEERLIHKCSKCVSSICLNCANSTILGQLANNCPLKCLFCQTLLDKSQIATIKKATFNETPEEKISYKEMVRPQPVEIGFECLVCKKSADCDSQIILTKCKHNVCQKCLREEIESQKIWSKIPKCPICMEHIDQIQLKIIGVSLDTSQKSSGNEEDPKDICGICQQYLELNRGVTKALSFCEHRFCYQCIAKALNDQSFINRVPKCPICSKEVSSADIINLCGPEGFKRYMANKRKK